MKKVALMLAMVFVLMGSLLPTCFAAPSLVCDFPTTGMMPEYYVVSGLPAPLDGSHIPAATTGPYGFVFDMALTPAGGPYTLKAKACAIDSFTHLEVCSADSLPFTFSRPPVPSLQVPTNTKLDPQ